MGGVHGVRESQINSMAIGVHGYNHGVPEDIGVEVHQQPGNTITGGLHHLSVTRATPVATCDPLLHGQACAQHDRGKRLVCQQWHRLGAQSKVTGGKVPIVHSPGVEDLLLVCCPIGGAIGEEREEAAGTNNIAIMYIEYI